MLFAVLLWCMPSWAFTPEELETLLAGVEEHRANRIGLKPPTFTAADRKKAADGQIMTGTTKEGSVYGYGIVRAPIAKLWSALNDETRQYQYTAVSYSEIVKGQPCEPGRRVFQYLEIGVMFVSDRWWIGVPTANETIMRDSGGAVRELAFKSSVDPAEITSKSAVAYRDAAAPIGFSKGAWFLVALDARHTWVEYHVYSDPGSGIPGGLANRLAAGGVRDNFAAMAKFANEGNPSCPIR
ncbi:MAG: hypothetical protein H6737_15125 [Alphaproteobacteria bacterium]|nr:hypothetical protein [Alphaproteobacteria bacterium]